MAYEDYENRVIEKFGPLEPADALAQQDELVADGSAFIPEIPDTIGLQRAGEFIGTDDNPSETHPVVGVSTVGGEIIAARDGTQAAATLANLLGEVAGYREGFIAIRRQVVQAPGELPATDFLAKLDQVQRSWDSLSPRVTSGVIDDNALNDIAHFYTQACELQGLIQVMRRDSSLTLEQRQALSNIDDQLTALTRSALHAQVMYSSWHDGAIAIVAAQEVEGELVDEDEEAPADEAVTYERNLGGPGGAEFIAVQNRDGVKAMQQNEAQHAAAQQALVDEKHEQVDLARRYLEIELADGHAKDEDESIV